MKKLLLLFVFVAFIGVSATPAFAATRTNQIELTKKIDDPKKKKEEKKKDKKGCCEEKGKCCDTKMKCDEKK